MTLTVGLVSQSDTGEISVLPYQEGYFKQLNLNVKYVLEQSVSAGAAAMQSGSLDLLSAAVEGLTINQQGGDIRAVAGEVNRSVGRFITAKNITSLNQLYSLSAPLGWAGPESGSGQGLELGLQASNIDTGKVKFVTIGTTALLYKALLAGKISGAPLASPYSWEAVANGFKDWGPTDGTPPNGLGAEPTVYGSLEISQKVMDSKKVAVQRFLEGYVQSMRDLFNPAVGPTLAKWLAADIGMPQKYLDEDYNSWVSDPATKGTYMNKDGTVSESGILNTCTTDIKFGELPKSADCSKLSSYLTDNEPITTAAKTLDQHPLKARLSAPLPVPLPVP